MASRAELSSRASGLLWPLLFRRGGETFWFPRHAELVIDPACEEYTRQPMKAMAAVIQAGLKGQVPPLLTGVLVVRHGWPWSRRTAQLPVFRPLPRGNWRWMPGDHWTPGLVVEKLEIRMHRMAAAALREQLEARHG